MKNAIKFTECILFEGGDKMSSINININLDVALIIKWVIIALIYVLIYLV